MSVYTSDAADERSSVDHGGRRIIKKKRDYDERGGTYKRGRKRDKNIDNVRRYNT